jgi:hypothetical protein
LKAHYWKIDKVTARAIAFWEDSLRYLYLPRLKTREVLASVIRTGAASRDFFGTAYGQTKDKYDGFQFGDGNVSFDDTLLLIEPDAARQYAIEQKKLIAVLPPEAGTSDLPAVTTPGATAVNDTGRKPVGTELPLKTKSFRGSVDVNAALAKSKLNTIADEVIKLLVSDPNATVRITLEIDAEFPSGASDTIKRGVSENATSLNFRVKDWE